VIAALKIPSFLHHSGGFEGLLCSRFYLSLEYQMNNSRNPGSLKQTQRIGVFINNAESGTLKRGRPALFIQPDAHLFEAPTSFLRSEYVESGMRASPSTWAAAAYALASWFDFLCAIGIGDWRAAARDDLIMYRDSYAMAISPKTGRVYASITISNRMSVILEFHRYAGARGWYGGDILAEIKIEQVANTLPIDGDMLAHIRKGQRTIQTRSNLLPRRRQARTSIRPFFDNELRELLNAVGPRATECDGEDQRPSRDRLICDLGWACGLRLDEIHQLTTLQMLSLHPEQYAPVAEQSISIVGKGRKRRNIAIPNWLVFDALAYIGGERKRALAKGAINARHDKHALLVAGLDSNFSGRPISHRRMQQQLEEACLQAGLVEQVKRTDPETGEFRVERKSRHCVHDLRHTYAVLTYWAEKESGNAEPWKKIQVQLGHAHLSTTIDTYLSFVEIFGDRQHIVDVRKMIGL
jgi:integrase